MQGLRPSRVGKREHGSLECPSSSRKMLSEHFLTSIQLEESRDPDSVASHGSFRALEGGMGNPAPVTGHEVPGVSVVT